MKNETLEKMIDKLLRLKKMNRSRGWYNFQMIKALKLKPQTYNRIMTIEDYFEKQMDHILAAKLAKRVDKLLEGK